MSNIQWVIEQYNLSIRRIPNKVCEIHDIRHYQAGDEIIENNGRKFCRRYKIPKNAGKYMCKQVNDIGSIVRWNLKTDNLSDTLQESINLFLEKQSKV